jgi:hypothetical protein
MSLPGKQNCGLSSQPSSRPGADDAYAVLCSGGHIQT